MSLLRLEPSVLLDSLVDSLSSKSLLGDESLDLWSLVEDLIILALNLLGDGSSDDVLSNIILSLSEDESLSDVLGSLWSESSWSVGVGKSSDLSLTLDEDLEGDNGKIRSADASSGGLSLSFTRSSWSVESGSLLHEDLDSAVDQDTLLHGETLLVVSTGDSEGVSLELGTENLSVDIGAHSSVVEVTIDFVIIDFLNELLSSGWV